jgi:hypothetical protein
LHIFAVSRLMTPLWLRQLFKASDMVFLVPAGCPFWPDAMYEPLTIGISFPFLRSNPWQIRRTPKVLSVGRTLRKMFQEEPLAAGNFLRQFLLECRRLRTLPELVVRRVLFFESIGDQFPHSQGSRRGGKRKRKRSAGPSASDSGLGQEGPVRDRLSPGTKRGSHSRSV